jgi:predicted RND superfamily exporter protein
MTPGAIRGSRIRQAIEPLIYARRGLTMGVLLAITLVLGWQALQLRFEAGFDKAIPLEHPGIQVYKQYQPEFGGTNTL